MPSPKQMLITAAIALVAHALVKKFAPESIKAYL